MELEELGLQLRDLYPHLRQRPGTPAQLAQFFIENYPDYQDLISPIFRKINEVAKEDFRSGRLTEAGRLESEKEFEKIRKRKIENLHMADMVMEATAQRVPVTALHDIAVHTHKVSEEIRLHKERSNNSLDMANRNRLTNREIIREMEQELAHTINRYDRETHPEHRKDLLESIEHQRKALRGRRQQEVVQVTGGPRLDLSNEDSDGGGSSREGNEGGVQPESSEANRVGFGAWRRSPPS